MVCCRYGWSTQRWRGRRRACVRRARAPQGTAARSARRAPGGTCESRVREEHVPPLSACPAPATCTPRARKVLCTLLVYAIFKTKLVSYVPVHNMFLENEYMWYKVCLCVNMLILLTLT